MLRDPFIDSLFITKEPLTTCCGLRAGNMMWASRFSRTFRILPSLQSNTPKFTSWKHGHDVTQTDYSCNPPRFPALLILTCCTLAEVMGLPVVLRKKRHFPSKGWKQQEEIHLTGYAQIKHWPKDQDGAQTVTIVWSTPPKTKLKCFSWAGAKRWSPPKQSLYSPAPGKKYVLPLYHHISDTMHASLCWYWLSETVTIGWVMFQMLSLFLITFLTSKQRSRTQTQPEQV